MPFEISVNDKSFLFPLPGETDWGSEVNGWALTLSESVLSPSVSSFPIQRDLTFGSTYSIGAKSFIFAGTPYRIEIKEDLLSLSTSSSSDILASQDSVSKAAETYVQKVKSEYVDPINSKISDLQSKVENLKVNIESEFEKKLETALLDPNNPISLALKAEVYKSLNYQSYSGTMPFIIIQGFNGGIPFANPSDPNLPGTITGPESPLVDVGTVKYNTLGNLGFSEGGFTGILNCFFDEATFTTADIFRPNIDDGGARQYTSLRFELFIWGNAKPKSLFDFFEINFEIDYWGMINPEVPGKRGEVQTELITLKQYGFGEYGILVDLDLRRFIGNIVNDFPTPDRTGFRYVGFIIRPFTFRFASKTITPTQITFRQ